QRRRGSPHGALKRGQVEKTCRQLPLGRAKERQLVVQRGGLLGRPAQLRVLTGRKAQRLRAKTRPSLQPWIRQDAGFDQGGGECLVGTRLVDTGEGPLRVHLGPDL